MCVWFLQVIIYYVFRMGSCGLASYFLSIFGYKKSSNQSAIKAIIFNRKVIQPLSQQWL
jgi:predicted ferric reductase